jgi:3-phosphoinositide dependent protein kinase-1
MPLQVAPSRGAQSDRAAQLAKQRAEFPWSGFLQEGELMLRSGLVDKRKGLFSKRRVLILTDKPRLIYIDPVERVCKGEIKWTKDLFPRYKNASTFFVHTVRPRTRGEGVAAPAARALTPRLQPDRTYFLDDVEKDALGWCDTILQVQRVQRQVTDDTDA